jgi:hypothetical protein
LWLPLTRPSPGGARASQQTGAPLIPKGFRIEFLARRYSKAARTMATLDAGVLPVGEKDHLIGMITDRDIAIRGIAEGKGPDAKVRVS